MAHWVQCNFIQTNPVWVDPSCVVSLPPIGGGIPHDYRRTRGDIAEARERFGIPDEAKKAIADVAARQAERLELDEQKRFEELSRELKIRGIEWEGQYLEALNIQRERLINAEIAARIRQKIDDEDVMILLLLVAASCA